EYVAHKEIYLLPGFHAQAGSHFTARIEPCFECNTNTNRSMLSKSIEDEIIYFGSYEDSLFMHHKNNLSKNMTYKITLYPNPNSGSFTIGINDIQEIQQIQVFSPIGQMVYSVQNPDNNMINLPAAAKGTFFVKIITQTETVIKKIIVK
ncbi:MAG: T9SS type A sorting domain-containing protein, partial [Bacteroidales bacterium]|nr:T9SS type A sorting domain-containing protein [Bacteroidales bacterium]